MITLFYIVAVLIVAGLLLWFLGQVPAIDPAMQQLIRAVIIIFDALFALLELFGLFSGGVHGFPGPVR